MKKLHIILTLLFVSIGAFSQNNNTVLYLLLDKPQYYFSCEQNLEYGFAINSKDKRFLTDYYVFNIYNIKGFSSNNKYDYEYYTLDELRKEISIDTINYKTIKEFTNKKKSWEIHNELSLLKNIYLIEKNKIKSNKPILEYKYYIISAIYEGTRKNIIPTNLSK